ncbi:MAG: ABC transporter permease [Bacteroidales bacterium]
MNTELYITKKIIFDKSSSNISSPIITIAKFAVALSMAVMIISIAIVTGFKSTIREKVIGFSSHIQINDYNSGNALDSYPIEKNTDYVKKIKKLKEVKYIQSFIIKFGIIQYKDNIQGVLLKGIDKDYHWDFFKEHLIAGEIFAVEDSTRTNKVLLSEKLANTLHLEVGDKFTTAFTPKSSNDNIRYREFTISGIYRTNLSEFDNKFIVCDIKHLQRINNWTENQVSGFEIQATSFKDIEKVYNEILEIIGYGFMPDGSKLQIQTIEELYPQIFEWLELLDMNVIVILILMTLVAGMNMISGLLVIILEKTNMIGLLKALGAKDLSIRKIFLYNGIYITSYGIIWGNLIGIAICLVQYYTRILPLNPETYFIDYVPVNINIFYVLVLNILSIIVTFAMLILPSYIITNISPIKALKFN